MFQELALIPFHVTNYHAERYFIVLLCSTLAAAIRVKPETREIRSLYADHCSALQDKPLNTEVDPLPETSSELNTSQAVCNRDHNISVNNERCDKDYVQ
jgi:hypothetical protein